MSLILNPSVAVAVTVYQCGPAEIGAVGETVWPVVGELPGARLDVQRECLTVHPGLSAFEVHPAEPVHDCGPNGVRLYAATVEALQAAAPVTGSPWDVWIADV